MISRILNAVQVRAFYWFSRLFASLVPKRKDLILFCAQKGRYFSGNAKSLFLYMKDHSEFDCIWITREKGLYGRLTEQYGSRQICFLYSLRGLKLVLTAKTVVLTHGMGDIPNTHLGRGTHIVQTWHGTPLKRLGVLDYNNTEEAIWRFTRETARYKVLISSSMVTSWALSACFGMDARKIPVTGQPRNDILFEKVDREPMIKALYPDIPEYEKLVLYAPTWREKEDARFFPFNDMNWDALQEFLERHKMVIFLRGHINDQMTASDMGSRIRMMNQDKVDDIQEWLGVFDFVITDYSSIYMDFLLLDRPILFIPYDLEEYKKTRGLLYDYEWVTPGPKVYNFYDFIGEMREDLLDEGRYREERRRVNDFFNAYKDGGSSERIARMIKDLL